MAKQYRQNASYRDILDGEEGEEPNAPNGSSGNTRLPFGLCERYGISLPKNATPRMAWEALKKGTGLTPEQVYAELRNEEKKKRDFAKGIYDDNAPQKKNFVPAKSTQEAETYARDSLGIDHVDYKGIDLEVANEMNSAIQRGMDICPKIKDRMKFIGNAQRVNKAFREEYAAAVERYARNAFPGLSENFYKQHGKKKANQVVDKMPGTAVALARMGAHPVPELNAVVKKYEGIIANEKLCNNAQRLKETLEFNKQIGHLSVGTITGTFDHEVAHQIDFALGLSKNAEMAGLYHSMSYQEIASGLSRYGAGSIAEFIAEGWAEYCNSDAPRPIAKRIGEIIKREAKR